METGKSESRLPGLQRVETAEDIARIVFVDDMAEIEVPIEAFDHLPLTNAHRDDSGRLSAVTSSIRWRGFDNFDRIIARLGRRGRLSIVNGGHRLTAARKVAKEWLPNLFRRKVTTVQMIVFRTANSGTMIGV
ncbi:MAG: ParB N-terminal domain-containing protein, partial [Pseudomonadota bacterium]